MCLQSWWRMMIDRHKYLERQAYYNAHRNSVIQVWTFILINLINYEIAFRVSFIFIIYYVLIVQRSWNTEPSRSPVTQPQV